MGGQFGPQILRQNILEKGQFIELVQLRLIQRQADAHSAIQICLRHRVDDFVVRFRHKKAVVLDRCRAGFQHFDAPQKRP